MSTLYKSAGKKRTVLDDHATVSRVAYYRLCLPPTRHNA